MVRRPWRGGILPLVALATLFPASAQAAFPPFSFAEVDFESDCRPNEAFARLLTVLHGSRLADSRERAIDQPLYDAVAGDTWHRLILDHPVEWHGLHLKRVDLHLGIERGPSNYTLVFDESPTMVREVWHARGWQLLAVGERRDIDGQGYASIMLDGVEGGGASVTCFRD